MADRSRAEILKEINSLPTNEKILGDPKNWAMIAAVAFFVSPYLSAAILGGYGLRRGIEYFSIREKRSQLFKEYHNAPGGMENY